MNEFGPLHEYDDCPFGPEDKFRLLPAHTGLLLEAVAAGAVFTVTDVVAFELHEPLLTVTVYVPLAAVVTLLMFGFCCDELNEFGPLHE